MMIVKLFCPKCAHAASKSLVDYAEIDVPLPVSRLSDEGRYEVVCGHGHTSSVVLNNLKFELLFEMGINAVLDGYSREAVSSFSAALERFYEFYWRVAMNHLSIPQEDVGVTWKTLSRQSERQLGAFVAASLALTKKRPRLLNPNKEVEFRNNVIHRGYIPTDDEAIEYGDSVMTLMNREIETLRQIAPEALKNVYNELLPKGREEKSKEDITGAINVLTVVDVMHPAKPGDVRHGSVVHQFARILQDREPGRMALVSDEEMQRRRRV